MLGLCVVTQLQGLEVLRGNDERWEKIHGQTPDWSPRVESIGVELRIRYGPWFANLEPRLNPNG
jgi:hypothetical protein